MDSIARQLIVLWLALGLCCAQKFDIPVDSTGPATFGITVYDASGLRGEVYHLPSGTVDLPNFKRMKPVGTIYTNSLNIPPRDFTDGFPGVTDRFEWFAIDYTGKFWIAKPGKYAFALLSDDGSKLYIDGKTIIDNDGTHSPLVLYGNAKLTKGLHTIRVSFFQGPRTTLALMLGIGEEGAKDFKIFDTRNFLPPKNLAELPNPEAPQGKQKSGKSKTKATKTPSQ